jgi:hypothetical protein
MSQNNEHDNETTSGAQSKSTGLLFIAIAVLLSSDVFQKSISWI